ncbi:MAG: ABC transporter permease subunit [Deltaproteobacteria bacterium]|nr:ABC transporter permease subunit [Deltaproteobacteria bacterium]
MKEKGLDRLLVFYAWTAALVLLLAVLAVFGFLLQRGLPVLNLKLIFGNADPLAALGGRQPVFDGLYPAIVGTLMLVVLAVTLAVPVGLGAGIYLAEYSRGRQRALLGLFFDILAGTPSIIVGLFGLTITIFLHRCLSAQIQPCLLISALSLAFLVLPYLARTTQAALEEIEPAVRLTAPALGASRRQNLFLVLLPQALPGIGSGILLAIGRCAEDTAVIMLTGAVAAAGLPRSLLDHYEALPFSIYYYSSQYANPEELQRGYGAALILLATCALLFILAFVLRQLLTRSRGIAAGWRP